MGSSPTTAMTEFSEAFERIYVISLPWQTERLGLLLRQLKEQGIYEPRVKVFRAVHGDSVGVPAWWKSGGGAWGCLLSHAAVIQDAIADKLENFLVLEDDALLSDHLDEDFHEFWADLPEDWEQVYLGGQHLVEPKLVASRVFKVKDMNRTHAFALKKSVFSKVHAHILHAPDYISAYNDGWHPHVDHQLGRAHRRGDWKVYSPVTHLVGQRENQSSINGNWHPDKWWDWPSGKSFRFLPYVIVGDDGLFRHVRGKHWRGRNRHGEVASHLHFGWKLGENMLTYKEAWEDKVNPATMYDALSVIASQAFECRRLPAFYGTEDQVEFVKAGWPGGTVSLGQIAAAGHDIKARLGEMADYPWNGLLERWKLKEEAAA